MKPNKSSKKEALVAETNPLFPNKSSNLLAGSKEVLVPIDFSDCSKFALRYALAFARQFAARITLISVVNDPRTSFELGHPEYRANLDARKKTTEEALGKLAASELKDLPYRLEIRSGRPYEEIVKAASELNADLVIISTHGETGESRVELGSTAERVIRYAPCPVLVVRPKERAA